VRNPYRVAFCVGFALVQGLAMVTGGKLVCRLVGHDPSWWLGVSYGFDRPVCHRCGAQL
jgi:hypothetical protein